MLALLHSLNLWSERYPLYTVLIDFYLDSVVAKDKKLAVVSFIKQLNYGVSVSTGVGARSVQVHNLDQRHRTVSTWVKDVLVS